MTNRERTLGTAFLFLILAGGAFLGALYMKAWKERVDQSEYALELRNVEAEVLLEQKELWQQRGVWLKEKQPAFSSRKDVELELNQLIDESVSGTGVELLQNAPAADLSAAPGMLAPRMTVQALGEFEPVMKWLHSLQEPELFIGIPVISITPNDEETAKVNVVLEVEKWYRQTEDSDEV